MLTTRKDVAMPYMEGDSRVGCIEHEHCVEGSVVSTAQCRLSVAYTVSESELTKASLLSSLFLSLDSTLHSFLLSCLSQLTAPSVNTLC